MKLGTKTEDCRPLAPRVAQALPKGTAHRTLALKLPRGQDDKAVSAIAGEKAPMSLIAASKESLGEQVRSDAADKVWTYYCDKRTNVPRVRRLRQTMPLYAEQEDADQEMDKAARLPSHSSRRRWALRCR